MGSSNGKPKICTVIVLGELGRSPRMCYHAYSLAQEGYEVDFVGYKGPPMRAELESHPGITQHHLRPFPLGASALLLPLKLLWLLFSLLWALLFSVRSPRFMLVQTPPALPALPAVAVCARLRGALAVFDWHNFGYTLLALRLSPGSLAVRAYELLERRFARWGHRHFCVSRAMGLELRERWAVDAHVLHDRAPAWFRPEPPRRAFLARLRRESGLELPERGFVVVSSTSWTPDEDFGVLLAALDRLDVALDRALTCFITGTGPLREHYRGEMEKRTWKHVRCACLWLEAADYPSLLGAADLGVSLHYSSSNLDLPMKIVDMFGAGLPVCAVHYDALEELVPREVPPERQVGWQFEDAAELAEQVLKLIERPEILEGMRKNLENFPHWHEHWKENFLQEMEKEN